MKAERIRHSIRRVLSAFTLERAKYPGSLKREARGQVHSEFRKAGYFFVDGQEWEDGDGWNYEISDMPMKTRP